jgi:5-hydroxyisourate hydrolase
MNAVTTHILDIDTGNPAVGIHVTLEFFVEKTQTWLLLGRGKADGGGRVPDLLPKNHVLERGLYRLRFDTSGATQFFPEVIIQFHVADAQRHYHIPLLLSAYGYTTYRGE